MEERGQRVWPAGVDWLRQTFGMGASNSAPAPRYASTESTETDSPDVDAVDTDEVDEADTYDVDVGEDDAPASDLAWDYAGDSQVTLSAALSRLPARFAAFIRGVTVEGWLWVAVILLGAVLRVWGMGDKPLHHDESMHAFFSLSFIRAPASYVYDPLLHGPFQFHAEGFIFGLLLAAQWLFHVGGASGSPWINDATARILPVLLGTGIVALPIGLRRELGRAGALIAGVILAISPAFVYFSRFLREDIYFNFFMFAIVVCAVRFARDRSTTWLIGLVASFVLAYATFEGIFLTMLIFVAYLIGLLLWELADLLADRLPITLTWRERIFFARAGLFLFAAAVGSILAYIGLGILHSMSKYVVEHPQESDAKLLQLENNTVNILLWVSILVAIVVIGALLWQMFYEPPAPRQFGEEAPKPRFVDQVADAAAAPGHWAANARAELDPGKHPFLRLLLGVNWVQWFVALVVGWMLFAALFWVIPGGQATDWGQGFRLGIGKGIWQGLYYWMQQQEVARGGQPWYYYLLVIPLYEQLVVVFGLVGLVYALMRPNRFRIFLVWWFLGSLALYSWAGEKMPWLTIHILLPLVLLAAVFFNKIYEILAQAYADRQLLVQQPKAFWTPRVAASLFAAIAAVALLIPMVHSMWILSHQDAANGPLEMMVYVQTTDDVNTVMRKIADADKRLHGGQRQLRIGVGREQEWPMYWYLRDYFLDPHPDPSYAFFQYPASDPNAQPMDVMILTPADGQAFMANHPTGYTMKQYKLRSWWDEAYKPPPCVPSSKNSCSGSSQWGAGVGVPLYLSYGSNPPPNARFDLGRATNRIWRWLWLREPLGDTNGSFDFVMIVNNNTGIHL